MFITHQCGDNKDAAVAVCDGSFRYEISQLDHADIVWMKGNKDWRWYGWIHARIRLKFETTGSRESLF